MLRHQGDMEILSWFALAPLVVLALIVGALRICQRESEATLREDILRAGLLIGVWIALGTEGSQRFYAISSGGVLGFWLASNGSHWNRTCMAMATNGPAGAT